MPVQSWAHSHYWAGAPSTVVPPPNNPIDMDAGYPAWQGSVILGSAFGPLGEWIAHHWRRLVWLYRFAQRVDRLPGPDRALVERVIRVTETSAWPVAHAAVKTTATTLGFNRPEAWLPLHRALKENRKENENRFRHLEACRLLRATAGSTFTNPECHLIVELAYQRYTLSH